MLDLEALLEEIALGTLLFAGGQLLLLIVVTFVALRFSRLTVRAALSRLFEREAAEGTAQDVSVVELQRRRDTLDDLIVNSLRVIILIVAFVMALAILRLDITPAIAGLGIAGLAFSLGAQHLVRDYVAGAFILIENQYVEGDVVRIAGITGEVADVSLRRTTLRDLDGTVHHVPHGLIETSSNLTRTWARVNLDIPVPYGTPFERVQQLVDESARQIAEDPVWKDKIIEAPRTLRIDKLGDMGMVIKVLGSVRAAEQWSVAGELRRLIVQGAERNGLVLGWRTVTAVAIQGGQEKENGRQS